MNLSSTTGISSSTALQKSFTCWFLPALQLSLLYFSRFHLCCKLPRAPFKSIKPAVLSRRIWLQYSWPYYIPPTPLSDQVCQERLRLSSAVAILPACRRGTDTGFSSALLKDQQIWVSPLFEIFQSQLAVVRNIFSGHDKNSVTRKQCLRLLSPLLPPNPISFCVMYFSLPCHHCHLEATLGIFLLAGEWDKDALNKHIPQTPLALSWNVALCHITNLTNPFNLGVTELLYIKITITTIKGEGP